VVECPARSGAALRVSELRGVYDGSGAAWARGPSRLYDKLALRIIEPTRLQGALVLDAGAGTGAVCRALRRAGATPVALDTSADMLAQLGTAALHAVIGDICSEPFADGTFDAAVSAFVLSHVEAPERALAEMRRVVKPLGAIIAAVFGAAPTNASKDVVDRIAADYGFVAPAWYTTFKSHTEPLTNTPERFRACAGAAGLSDITILDVEVDSGIDTPEALVEYRIGMAHLAPFVSSLSPPRRERFMLDAADDVAARGQAVRPRVLVLSSRASA
jgi:ubiquinone/menaquinone biosynthesis C-methylase UbiE